MADDEGTKQDGEGAAAEAGTTKAPAADSEFGADDLMDLFEEEESVNEELMLLCSTLGDVDIRDLLDQVREVQEIVNERLGY